MKRLLFPLFILINNFCTSQICTLSATATSTNVSCNGLNNGIGAVSYTGAVGSVSFLWQPSLNTSQIANNLTPGIHTITVTDANYCSATQTVLITNPPVLSINSLTSTNTNCGQANGSATVVASGGTGTINYFWNPGGYTASVVSGLTAGNYSVVVTDINGCQMYSITTINDIQGPVLTSQSTGSITCYGLANGYGGVTAAGGMAPLTYSWSYQGQTTPTVTNLPVGLHSIVIKDAANCVTSATFNIQQPTQLVTAIASQTNVSCNGGNNGSASLIVNGGILPYSYNWSNGQNTATLSNVNNGVFSVTVSDANSCLSVSTVTITQPQTPSVSLTGTASCTSNTFSMSVQPAGGTPPYTYIWMPGSNTSSNVAATLTAQSVYTAVATDANGCSIMNTITAVPQVTATVSATNISCSGLNNGIVYIKPIGASGPMSFVWQPNVSASQTAAGLSPGIYTVTMTDANNCTVTKTVTITQPPALAISSLTNTAAHCGQANGSSTVYVSGGTAPFSYQWNSNPSYTQSALSNIIAGTYTVIVSDANGCVISGITAINDIAGPTITSIFYSPTCFSQSTGSASVTASGFGTLSYIWSYLSQTTPTVNNLPAGVHTVTVSDIANCLSLATVTIGQGSAVNAGISSFTNVTCSGFTNGGATAIVSGGIPAYSYSWIPSSQTSSVLSNIGPGTYTLNVKDANNCVGTNTVLITQPNPLFITTNTVVNVSCFSASNGSISTSISGGNLPYVYSWNPSVSTTSAATNLNAMTYTYTVTDNMGCTTNSVYTVVQPPALMAFATSTSFACGGINGSASVTIGGGTSPYSYNWNTSPPQNTNTATGLNAGNYTLTVTDNNGCIFTKSVSITSAALPTISISSSDTLICDGGVAYLTASGASSYFWSTGNIVPFIMVTPTITTNYTVTGTATNGCSNTAVITQSVTDCTSLSEHSSNELKFAIYPNPFTQIFNVDFHKEVKEIIISIYNVNGQLVFSKRYFSHRIIPVNIANLHNGLFFVEVNSDGKISGHKVVKE